MSYYIKTKFKIGQEIFSIKNDQIEKITIESIRISTEKEIAYLAKNTTYLESQSFDCYEAAKEFMDQAYRIPFKNGDLAWEGDLRGVKHGIIKDNGCFFFKEDLKQPHNRQIHIDNMLNSTTTCETQIEATKQSLKMVEDFENRNKSR